MRKYIKIFLLIGVVQCRNLSNREDDEIIVFEEGFNHGQSNGQSGYNPGDQQNGGSGYNAGDQQNGGSGYNAGDQQNGESGYNAGNQQNGGSGYNAGNQEENNFNPHIPDFIPDESITGGGNSGFNPGRDNSLTLGSRRPNSRPDPSGRPDAHPNTNSGFNPGAAGLGVSGFRTPIVFADEEEVQSVGEEEEGPRVVLLQSYPGYYPLLQTLPSGLVSATTLPAGVREQQYVRGVYPVVGLQTLPSQILFEEEEREEYVPGTDKQQYLRGRQTLPSPVVFTPAEEAPYVPGANKQQYLRGPQRGPQYVPLIKASNPQTGISVETLPGPIVFAPADKAPYVPGTNKQQYLRGRQTRPFSGGEYRPLVEVEGDSVFAGGARAPYVPGTNKQQYLRNNVAAQTLPSPITFASEEESENFALLTPRKVNRPALTAGDRDLVPGVSSRPSFPPGFRPRQASAYSQEGQDRQYQGPKNVLYFFK